MRYCQGCGADVEAEEAATGVEHECEEPSDWDPGIEWTT